MEYQPALPLEAGVNFRDMGGILTHDKRRLKKHKLIRSAMLATLSEADLKYLADYGVKYDVDLRTKTEVTEKPDRLPDGAQYVFNPVLQNDETQSDEKKRLRQTIYRTKVGAAHEHMLQVYRDIVSNDTAKKAYRKLFAVMLENTNENQSVIFHCAAGKDRTGMAAVYILAALGVDIATIKADYLASNHYLADFQAKQNQKAQKYGATYVENTHSLNSVHPEYFAAALDEIQKTSGSLANFLQTELGLDDEKIARLKELYLTD